MPCATTGLSHIQPQLTIAPWFVQIDIEQHRAIASQSMSKIKLDFCPDEP